MEKMNDKRKKILVVTHQYLPHVSPRTTRWKLIVDDLINKGHEVTVITGTQQSVSYTHLTLPTKRIV